jgi:peptide/nickel transport system substrate-binding protein
VWEIERKLAEDGARPIIFYNRFAYCWQPPVKGWTMMVSCVANHSRNSRTVAGRDHRRLRR